MTSGIGEGSQAPDFRLVNDKFDEISLSDYKGKNIVLYFYPKNNTPGCTQQAIDFTELKGAFTAADTIVIGISKDDAESHSHFKDMKKLDVILVADPDLDAIEKYGVWVEKNMYGKKYMGIERSTFLINKEGVVAKAWRKVRVKGHVEEVLNASEKLQ